MRQTSENPPSTHFSAVGREKEHKEVTPMRRIILLLTVAALVVVSTLFVVSVAGAHKQSAAKAQKQPTRTVVIQNFRFKPAQITIKRGTRVRWINKDTSPHTVTANKKGSFNSGILRRGKSYSHTFKSTGRKAYHCNIHPDMRGRVVVTR
jgi:plastocyanin